MDDRGSLWPVHDYELKEVPRAIWPEHQIPDRILRDLFDDQRVLHDVVHVVGPDVMTKGRMENLHEGNVLRNRGAGAN